MSTPVQQELNFLSNGLLQRFLAIPASAANQMCGPTVSPKEIYIFIASSYNNTFLKKRKFNEIDIDPKKYFVKLHNFELNFFVFKYLMYFRCVDVGNIYWWSYAI